MICERLQFGYRFMNRMKPANDINMPEGTVMDLRSARHFPPLSGVTDIRVNGDCEEAKYSDTKINKKKTCYHSPITCNTVEDTRLPSPSLISYTPSCLEVSLAMTISFMVPFLPREIRPL